MEPEQHEHVHAHAHDHGPACDHEHHAHDPCLHDNRFSWFGLALGLGIHTLIDGLALGAAVASGSEHEHCSAKQRCAQLTRHDQRSDFHFLYVTPRWPPAQSGERGMT